MFQVPELQTRPVAVEAIWPIVAAILTMAAVHVVLPVPLRAGSGWTQLIVQAALLGLLLVARHRRSQGLMHVFGGATLAVATAALIYSLGTMFWLLAHRQIDAPQLLRAGGLLWVTTFLLFAVWYWRLDGGGAHQRLQQDTHTQGAFLFPQMSMDADTRARLGITRWHPRFIDYLFIAFTSSSAFSPTDVLPLSRWAKVLMMIQSSLSLLIVAVLAARAINML